MTDVAADEPVPKKGSAKKGLLLGAILGVVGAGAGYMATSLGYIPLLKKEAVKELDEPVEASPVRDFAFVDLPSILVSIEEGNALRHLRFTAKLEVPKKYEADVTKAVPRIVDILNGYLRAVETRDLTGATSLIRLRGQMLRRVNIVAGEGRIHDLLVMEFVLS